MAAPLYGSVCPFERAGEKPSPAEPKLPAPAGRPLCDPDVLVPYPRHPLPDIGINVNRIIDYPIRAFYRHLERAGGRVTPILCGSHGSARRSTINNQREGQLANLRKRSSVADVLIIGAGASGSVAAKHLAMNGFDVVCLEQGPWVDNGEFWGDKPEWELMAQKRWHPNPNVRDLETDYPCETSQSDVNPLMYSAVGGSTILYAAHWQRFMPSDFRVKTLDGVAEDWPFTYEDLEPFYDEIDVEMGSPDSAATRPIRPARHRRCRRCRSARSA